MQRDMGDVSDDKTKRPTSLRSKPNRYCRDRSTVRLGPIKGWRTMGDKLTGQLSACRDVLRNALDLMSTDQRTALLDSLSALITELTKRWGSDPSDFQRGIVHEYQGLQFDLRQRNKLRPTQDSREQKLYFVCIKCNTPIIDVSPNAICPICNTAEWLELTRT